MKLTGACPKCAHTTLLVVERVLQPDHESNNRTVPVYVTAAEVARGDTGVSEGTRHRSHASTVQAWVCAACGFVEWYARDPAELAALARHPDGGVRVVGGAAGSPRR